MRESSFKCETFEELIFASEPFDVVNGSICWGDWSFESLCHFTRLSVDQHTEGAEERRGLLSEERAGDSNCGKIHPAFGAQFIICLCTSMSEMQKVGDTGDIYISAIFLAGANFWAILGNFESLLGYFGSFLGHFLVQILLGQKCISAIFITFCISDPCKQCFHRSNVFPTQY